MTGGNDSLRKLSRNLFVFVIDRPKRVLASGLLMLAVLAAGAGRVEKDTSVEAFIPSDHVSIEVRDRAEEIFGLRDPIGIALIAPAGESLFEAERLGAVRELHEWISTLDNVRSDRVTSLASESWVSGEDDALEIEPYLEPFPQSREEARRVWERVGAMEPHLGTLVSKDGRGAMIVAELRDPQRADETYLEIMDGVTARLETLERLDLETHVAGQGAVTGFLSRSIDSDSSKLRPAAVVTILLVLLVSFRRLSSLAGPLVVLGASVLGTLGCMGWFGIPYYAITSALPVVLVAISVADAIHILTRYYEVRASHHDPGVRAATLQALDDMAGPVTVTTFTTVVGFVGIALTSIMPPITSFGWLAAFGVLLAWVYSLLVLPTVLILVRPAPSPVFRKGESQGVDRAGRWMAAFAARIAARPVASLATVAALTLVALVGASQLRIDRSQVDNFDRREPIAQAHRAIHATFAGTSYLDVIVETEEVEGLLDAERMAKILALQNFLESLPFVEQTTSIADYLSVLHRAIEPGADSALPEDDDAIAQYLFLQESAGDPTELEEEIDGEARLALVRAHLNSTYNSEEREAVERTERYLEEEFNEPGMTAQLSGRVNIDYHWMQRLGSSHFRGLLIALLMALAVAAALFRSPIDGLLALLPVLCAICAIYGAMGTFGVALEVATSMFAAISVGIGIDYGIHLIAQLRRGVEEGLDLEDAIKKHLPGPTRACFFNAAGIATGFMVLLLSELATLERFGALIALAALSSFAASLVLVPAGFGLRAQRARRRHVGRTAQVAALLLATLGLLSLPADARAEEAKTATQLDGPTIAARIAARDTSRFSRRIIEMEMTDRRDKVRRRTALSYRSTDVRGNKKNVLFFTAPGRIEGTAFLGHSEAGRDDRWLFLPATKRSRRIPASDRGDYFLGTDFTFEDVDNELTIQTDDHDLRNIGSRPRGDRQVIFLEAKPKSAAIAKELGYGRLVAQVDIETWTPLQVDFWDLQEQPLKTIEATELEWFPEGDGGSGVWAPRKITCVQHQNKHKTVFSYVELTYPENLDDDLFVPDDLNRGPR
ncbi:MAG: outer membrane lipoprotein-sorting protein [Acidobacteriota bacterium]